MTGSTVEFVGSNTSWEPQIIGAVLAPVFIYLRQLSEQRFNPGAPKNVKEPAVAINGTSDVLEHLERLAALYKEGQLTDAEFTRLTTGLLTDD